MSALRAAGSRRRDVVVAAVGLALAARSGAQGAYPDRPLRIVVPQPPGGGFDVVSRVLAERLAKQLGQPVLVENKPGSGTLVGTDFAAKAAPDGYTLLTGSVSNLALNMGLYRNLPYDSLRDFEPVGLASPEVIDAFRKAGGKPLALSDAATRALVQRDVERWSKLVRELDLKPE